MKNLVLLFKRLLIVLIAYVTIQAVFIGINNKYFHIDSFNSLLKIFWGGLRFDISSLIYINSIFIIFHATYYKALVTGRFSKAIKYLYLITNGFFIAINIADIVYYRFTFKRMQPEVFSILGDVKRLMIPYLYNYWYLLFFFILVMIVINWMYNKTIKTEANAKIPGLMRLISFVVLSGFVIVGARGGFQKQPIDSLMAVEYATPEQTNAVLNSPFIFLHALVKIKLPDKNYFSDEQVNKIFPVEHAAIPVKEKKPNIIIILLESFAGRFIGGLTKSKITYTPFLDSMMKQSTVFTNAFANGHVSIDGNFTTFFSVPPLANESLLYTSYGGNQFTGIASLLKTSGYASAFFHGADNGSLKIDDMSRLAGFDKFYGRTEYNNDEDYDGSWGIWDEPFLQFSVKKMNEIPQPFITGIFTVSSHHPFKLPEGYKTFYKEGTEPFHKVIQYTDYALKRFFETAATQTWYKNSIFFICADHSVISADTTEANNINQFRIPLLIFDPADIQQKVISHTVQQSDILPTILEITGTKKRFISFGNNMLDTNVFHFCLTRDDNTFRLFTDNYVLLTANEKPTALYDIKNDGELRKNIVNINIKVRDSLLNILKAATQQYNNRLNKNKMVSN